MVDISPKRIHRWPTSTQKDTPCHWSSGKCASKPQEDATSRTLGWLQCFSCRTQWNRCWGARGGTGASHLTAGNVKWRGCGGKWSGGSSKGRHRVTICPSNPTARYIRPREPKRAIPTKTCTQMSTASLFTTAKRWKRPNVH